MSRENHDSTLTDFETELTLLRPNAGALDLPKMMFLAGQASALASQPRRGLGWPAAFSAMTVVAATLAMMLVFRPNPMIAENSGRTPAEPIEEASAAVVRSQNESPIRQEARPDQLARVSDNESNPLTIAISQCFARLGVKMSPDERGYLYLRNQVLAKGADAIPNPTVSQRGPTDRQQQPASYRERCRQLMDERS